MMTPIQERFNKIKAAYGITNKMLAADSGMSIQTVINQSLGRFNLSLELVQSLVRLAPSIDVRWLVTGKFEEERIDIVERDIRSIKEKLGIE